MRITPGQVPMRSSACICAVVLLASAQAWCSTLTGNVVGVHDGDTLTVLVDRRPVKIRLAEIDAPELGQPYGTRSRQSLSAICFRSQADIQPVSEDRYGRTVAHVVCNGRDAIAEQVQQGMAWVYDRYTKPDSPLYDAQGNAMTARRGLWADRDAVAPWAWRRAVERGR